MKSIGRLTKSSKNNFQKNTRLLKKREKSSESCIFGSTSLRRRSRILFTSSIASKTLLFLSISQLWFLLHRTKSLSVSFLIPASETRWLLSLSPTSIPPFQLEISCIHQNPNQRNPRKLRRWGNFGYINRKKRRTIS